MVKVLPISCISCRRMKIKCNKCFPCDQCLRRGLPCQFPAKFRNIAINGPKQEFELVSDDSDSDCGDIISSDTSAPPRGHDSLASQIAKLKVENASLTEKYKELALHTNSSSESPASQNAIEILGETTEVGEKYYGPQLAHFMIKNLEAVLNTDMPSPDMSRSSSSAASHAISPDDGMPNLGNENNNEHSKRVSARRERMNQCLSKKKLPMLLLKRTLHDSDEEVFPKIEENALSLKNMAVISKLVNGFFERHTYHRSLFSRKDVVRFLEGYESSPEDEWEDDDYLLLVATILLSSVEALTPRECVDLGIIPKNDIESYLLYMRHLVKKVLLHNVLLLRHNLLNESHITVAAYILCAEWYFHSHQYEECWSMVFHACAVLYAIGLHIIGDLRKVNLLGGNSSPDRTASNEETPNDFDRFKLWFGLKYVAGQVCSILGRPNPLSIRATVAIMRSARNLGEVVDNDFERTSCKVGLSECLRLANMMVIESFMMDFNEDDLLGLDAKFANEVKVCETILLQSGSNKPIAIVYDLMVLLVNRAKLLHPFLAKFKDSVCAPMIADHMTQSLFRGIKCLLELINLFKELIKSVIEAEDSLDVEAKTRYAAKHCSVRFPFLSQWVHQGLIVIYSHFCQHYRSSTTRVDLVLMADLEKHLREALDAGSTIAGWPPEPMAFWLTNIRRVSHSLYDLFLRIRRNQYRMYDKGLGNVFAGVHKIKTEPLDLPILEEASGADYGRYDINMADPFWYTYPENVPAAMSSPRDSWSVLEGTGGSSVNLNLGDAALHKGGADSTLISQLEDILETGPYDERNYNIPTMSSI